MTLIELMVVVAIIGVVAIAATPSVRNWFRDQRVKQATRSVGDALQLARAEAIRTSDNVFVVFQGALGAPAPIAIVDDGAPNVANCFIDAGEVIHEVDAIAGVVWGTTPGVAGGTLAPSDSGMAPANVVNGATFTDATELPANPATWILFQADGMPRLFTPASPGPGCVQIGDAGDGGGAIYLTNGRRDYAAVLSPLGTVHLHRWDPSVPGWSQ
jgi:prepilin-type N-terminal cleavage/methylation domain-containing protein